MEQLVPPILWWGLAGVALLILAFFAFSPASGTAKFLTFLGLCLGSICYYEIEPVNTFLAELIDYAEVHSWKTLMYMSLAYYPYSAIQQKLRYARLEALLDKYGFTQDPATFRDMSIEVAQEVEANMAEWEFPRLYQFAWISDFLRTSTDPGVSRALIRSGHMVNGDPLVEHERLQATIHLISAFMAYPLKSRTHSLVIARINEHHHRYGNMINSDDILYLIIHFAMVPGHWVNRFGYRKLEPFEEHALWILWREIGVMMGIKYMPRFLDDAKEWRKEFEVQCRWPCDENERAGMAMLNEIIYSCPTLFKPFLRKVVVSILDPEIVRYCQMDKLGPSKWLRFVMYRIFDISGWMILHFGLPRMTPYMRTFEVSTMDDRLVNVRHTPYDTLPFYQSRSFWNLYGFGAVIRRVLLNLPAPSPEFYSNGMLIEAMGAFQVSHASQLTVEQKVREKATQLARSPAGYRPAIAYQAGRLLEAVEGPEYGADLNRYAKDTPIIPSSDERFEKKYEQRGPGFSKIGVIEEPQDIIAFDKDEAYSRKIDVEFQPL